MQKITQTVCVTMARFSLAAVCAGLYSYAHAFSGCLSNENQMPQYQVTFTFTQHPLIEKFTERDLVLRFYQNFGDGSSIGWQQPIKPPRVLINNKPIATALIFSYAHNYQYGSIGLGFDQFAQYYGVYLPDKIDPAHPTLTIQGTFQQVAYVSATIYSYITSPSGNHIAEYQDEIVDRQMPVLYNACNPYIEGNPSVFSYPSATLTSPVQTGNTKLMVEKFMQQHTTSPLATASPATDNGRVDAYRLDQATSKITVADDIAADGCSRAYLYATPNTEIQPVAILRIKVPITFIDSNHPDKQFGRYQATYFSVGSHTTPRDNPLSYWTVNARMLNDYKDKDGYAYVFFAPDSYVDQLAKEQHTPPTQPPVMTWGQYKGYLLGEPDYAIILRYRNPDPAWQGSPENAHCYRLPQTNQPVTKYALGDYLPEIYGDTVENFNNGNIGAVHKDSAWPR